MVNIRLNMFETNSSSTHSLVVCDDDTWTKFLNGDLYINIASHELENWTRHPYTASLPVF